MERNNKKLCGIICEYNPFHNGHLYQIEEIRRRGEFDGIVCLMSGNFVQRGEAAVLEKHIRAKHAVLAGADIVLELPTVFATAPAELFAKGAARILSSLPSLATLCFGAETADKQAFLSSARALLDEPEEISAKIKRNMDAGFSYAKARSEAWKELLPSELLLSPNNILGLEYTKAILQSGAQIDILPLARIGGGYKDERLQAYPSATAVRGAIASGVSRIEGVPAFVQADLPRALETTLESLEKYALLQKSAQDIASVCDCTEGLENAFKRAASLPVSLVESLTSARYTSSRIRRIALQTLLEIPKSLILEGLSSPLYLRVLAANARKKELLSALEGEFPILLRAHDEDGLQGVAKQLFQRDIFAEKLYALLYPNSPDKAKIFIERKDTDA